MKKCPFCAEEIQDAAIKCRFCGSMLTAPPADLTTAPPAGTPVDELDDEYEDSSTPWGLLLVLGLLILAALVIFVYTGRSAVTPDPEPDMSAAMRAATLVPATPAEGAYRFLDIGWGSSREGVRQALTGRGFAFVGEDEDGDDQYSGRIDGRDAGLAAMFADNDLTKFLIVLLPADTNGTVASHIERRLTGAYGDPAERRGETILWPERDGTLVWMTRSEQNVTVHFESAAWPEEARRRRGETDATR